jgi:hypothetical protein
MKNFSFSDFSPDCKILNYAHEEPLGWLSCVLEYASIPFLPDVPACCRYTLVLLGVCCV